MSVSQNEADAATGAGRDWLEIVRRQVDSLRFGMVQIVVHDSQVTQIEKTERLRLEKPGARGK
jgi:hypothetical protein